MRQIHLDLGLITSEDQLWDEIVQRSGHPFWHGRNLNALYDGWVRGGLDEHGPPYEFLFANIADTGIALRDLVEQIMAIAKESVAANGGSIRQA
jgi:RNAse (barnase) inhibitor barstar